MTNKCFFLILSLLLITSCSLNSSQEQSLNKHLSLYLDALEQKILLTQVSMYHPEFLKHIKSQGNEYFKIVFNPKNEEEQLNYSESKIEKIVSENEDIQVLFEIFKNYYFEGVNKIECEKLIAISEDNGKNWYFVSYKMYLNKKICKKVSRLLK